MRIIFLRNETSKKGEMKPPKSGMKPPKSVFTHRLGA